MTITINAQGAERKRLVKTISDWLGVPSKYCGAPTFNYEVDYFTIDRSGSLSFDDTADSEVVERLLQHIYDEGFDIDQSYTEDEATGLTVSLPLDKVDVGNLTKLLDAKGGLIKKTLGIDALPVEIGEDAISFPWFSEMPDADTTKAYTKFIAAICKMSREQKRITAKQKAVDNEKYAFRCFLLRLGFIGDEYKSERIILLRNLTGSSAFKSGAKKKYAPGLDPIPTPENTVMVDVEEVMKRLQDPQVQEEIRAIFNGGDGEQA